MKNIKKIVNSDAAYEILDSSNSAGSTWTSGGCAILAKALNSLYDYRIYVIYNRNFSSPEHFGVMTPSGSIVDADGEHSSTDEWLQFFKENEMPRAGELIVYPYASGMKMGEIQFDQRASDELAELIKNQEMIRETIREVLRVNIGEAFDGEYKSWKRKNVTIRGVQEIGEENNGGAMLGRGLYSAALSNKSLAKQYGKVYFVVGAIPNNPKVFDNLNEWEIWFYNKLVYQFSKEKGKEFPDKRDFNSKTTIESEMQKLGYDGIIIKGREMVNFNPGDVLYFEDENQLFDYYDYNVRLNEFRKIVRGVLSENKSLIDDNSIKEVALREKDLPSSAALFIREINQGYDLVLYDPKIKEIYGTITIAQREHYGPNYFVTGVAAERGFGPFIYELAMMHLSKLGRGLMPTRDGDVRDVAFNVWKQFFNRPDIKKETMTIDNPYYRFDILGFSKDEFDSEEEIQEMLSGLKDYQIQALNVFNTSYSMDTDAQYNQLTNNAENYYKLGFDIQVAIDKADEFWNNAYMS